MTFRKVSAFAFVSIFALNCAPLLGAPMSPSEKNVSGFFSGAVQDSFKLLADSDDPTLVYYVPAQGGIAVDAASSAKPLPQFGISSYTPSFGFFGGETLVRLGGSFSTTSYLGALNQLESEAKSKGLSVAPAPAATATTKFLLGAYEVSGGRLDISCTKEDYKLTKPDGSEKVSKVPKCKAKADPTDSEYSLDLNIMYKFATLPAVGNSVVSQRIPFQAITLPDTETLFRSKMETGGQWAEIMTAKIDWEVTAQRKTRQARFHINWESTFEQASAFAAYHNNSCVDIELKGFYQKLAQCSKEDECGIRVEYMNSDGTWGDKAPDNAAFVNAANEIQKRLNDELFLEVANKTKSQLGTVNQDSNSQFTLRANFEKILFSKNEVVPFAFNEGPEVFKASTTLNIACLKGGFEEGRVTWNMDDAGCKALIGQ